LVIILINLYQILLININLPFNIKYLKLDCNNQYIIDNLHNGIEKIVLDFKFNLELNDLPISIKKIIFNNDNYDKELNNLPNSIEYIELPYNYKYQNISKKLKQIKCYENYKYINDFVNYRVITYN